MVQTTVTPFLKQNWNTLELKWKSLKKTDRHPGPYEKRK